MSLDTSRTYDELADHYHLIFENWQASIDRQAAVLGSILEQCGLNQNARILDCACGIGTQSLGLAKRGFRMSGCDISPRSIERARREASQRNLDIQFSVADMRDFGSGDDSRFDAVICMDNALPHLAGTDELNRAIVQIQKRLCPGGIFMASIRDYDKLLEERPAVQGPSFYSDDGGRRIIFQVWDWLDRERYNFHLYITRETQAGWETLHTTGLYRALRRSEVDALLSHVGFRAPRWLFPESSGFYQPIVVAKAA
ncbi:MAG TPA: class I SAM-dependent methyltransferase [Candidatus Angelobacter sp.]|nr:class I SAM-dependent methyltransferase [Candidatus Angelobacter sp.]